MNVLEWRWTRQGRERSAGNVMRLFFNWRWTMFKWIGTDPLHQRYHLRIQPLNGEYERCLKAVEPFQYKLIMANSMLIFPFIYDTLWMFESTRFSVLPTKPCIVYLMCGYICPTRPSSHSCFLITLSSAFASPARPGSYLLLSNPSLSPLRLFPTRSGSY